MILLHEPDQGYSSPPGSGTLALYHTSTNSDLGGSLMSDFFMNYGIIYSYVPFVIQFREGTA